MWRWGRAAVAGVLVTGVLGVPYAASASASAAAGRCGDPRERPWCDTSLSPDRRASLLLAELTLSEKISLLAGDSLTGAAGQEGSHTGVSDGVERVGLPPVYFTDGPVGVRQGKATGMPSPMAVAASFSANAAAEHAGVVGDEARRKGNDVVFAPAVNMLRTPLNGRTFEYFGEDPYLASRMAVGWTRGVQDQGVIGNVKHFAVNNQEGIGLQVPGAPLGVGIIGSRFTVDARVDERVLREIYLPQFEAAVREGGVGSVMCSYNRVNGRYACENEHLLEDVLKRDWGFGGFVLTDYGAARGTASGLRNGLDLDIWPGLTYNPLAVRGALAVGAAAESDVDEHVRRILRTLFAFGFFDRAAYPDDPDSIDRDAHHEAAADIEARGMVLLRNALVGDAGRLLPLDASAVRKVAVIGPEADTLRDGGGSSSIDELKTVTPLAGLRERLGESRVVYDDGSSVSRAASVARSADVAVVVVGDRMTEGNDKTGLGLNADRQDLVDRDKLISKVAAAQPRTVAVLQTGGPVLTPWRDEVPALVEMWYPGQNGGTALARVLFGDTEPGGRLPATFPREAGDIPTAGDPRRYPGVLETAHYSEGVFIGYRHYDEHGIAPAFPFGHGLGYTEFAYGKPVVSRGGPDGAVVTVSAEVTNVGERAGSAAPQLYLGLPSPSADVPQPPRALKGFSRVTLQPGETRRVTFPLGERALAYWDTAADTWRVAPGCYTAELGASSRDIRSTTHFALTTPCPG